MARIIDQLLLTFRMSQVERGKAKARFLKDYARIVEEKRTKKREASWKNRLQTQEIRLLPLAIRAAIDTDQVTKEKQFTLDRIDKKYVWKELAVRETARRKTQKFPQAEAELLTKRDNALALLEQKKNLAIQKIHRHYEPDQANLVSAQTAYTTKKQALDQANDIYKTRRQKKYDLQDQQFRKRIDQQLSSIARAIETHQTTVKKNVRLEPTFASDFPEEAILRCEGLTMRFGGLVAVDNLSFDVKEGEIFGLIGPNGAGKTTVFNCITKFYRPNSGEMYFRKNPVEVIRLNDYPVHRIIRQGIVRTFQNVELIWELTVIDNLLVAAHSLFHTGFFGQLVHTRKLKQEEMVLKDKAIAILTKMGLAPYMEMIPYGLPYGILKKIELARTLMVEPRMIILDEPAAGLNDQETEELAKLIREIRDTYQVTIFLVEHDMGLVMDICDTVAAISFGKLLAIGTPKMIQANKVVRDAYLGEE